MQSSICLFFHELWLLRWMSWGSQPFIHTSIVRVGQHRCERVDRTWREMKPAIDDAAVNVTQMRNYCKWHETLNDYVRQLYCGNIWMLKMVTWICSAPKATWICSAPGDMNLLYARAYLNGDMNLLCTKGGMNLLYACAYVNGDMNLLCTKGGLIVLYTCDWTMLCARSESCYDEILCQRLIKWWWEFVFANA